MNDRFCPSVAVVIRLKHMIREQLTKAELLVLQLRFYLQKVVRLHQCKEVVVELVTSFGSGLRCSGSAFLI